MRISEGEASWISAARGIAAIIVLLTHAYYVFAYRFVRGIDTTLHTLGTGAEYAVYMFFFFSGFLITLSIVTNVRKNGHFRLWQYVRARTLRIYPPLVGAITLIFVVGALIGRFGGPLNLPDRTVYTASISDLWTALTLRSGFGVSDGVLWSLYVECQIYVIAAGIAMAVCGRPWQRLLGLAIALTGYNLPQTNEWFNFYGSIWVAGAAVGLIKGNFRVSLPAAPLWLSSTGDFSYSLYVVHFPLLLLGLSLQPERFSISQTWLYGCALVLVIGCFARAFASLFENFGKPYASKLTTISELRSVES